MDHHCMHGNYLVVVMTIRTQLIVINKQYKNLHWAWSWSYKKAVQSFNIL